MARVNRARRRLAHPALAGRRKRPFPRRPDRDRVPTKR
jgi:hypothetical protein